jgi:hypothetical protein
MSRPRSVCSKCQRKVCRYKTNLLVIYGVTHFRLCIDCYNPLIHKQLRIGYVSSSGHVPEGQILLITKEKGGSNG